MPVQCPNCGSRHLRDSAMKESTDKIRRWRFETALRCVDCKTRFVASTLALGDIFYAKCPVCRKLDLNSWPGKTYTPTGWTAFAVNLGAKKWRCEYCRLNFASFRKRKEVFSFKRWQRMNVGGAVSLGRAKLAEMEIKAAKAREISNQKAREAAAKARTEEAEHDDDE